MLGALALPPSYNVAPTQKVLVARQLDDKREGVVMRWGLIPSWAKDKKMAQINARADSASEKPMFRSAFKKRRCLVLADEYLVHEERTSFVARRHAEGPEHAGKHSRWTGRRKTLPSGCA